MIRFQEFHFCFTHATHLNVVEVHVLGKAAVLVNQKTESSFFFKESFSAAFCNKPLNITLSRAHCFQILRKERKTNHIHSEFYLILDPVPETKSQSLRKKPLERWDRVALLPGFSSAHTQLPTSHQAHIIQLWCEESEAKQAALFQPLNKTLQ